VNGANYTNYSIDGNTSTFWASTAEDSSPYLKLNLSSTYLISKLIVRANAGTGYCGFVDYNLSVSPDDSTYTDVVISTGNPTNYTNTHQISPMPAMYIKLTGIVNSDPGCSGIGDVAELEAYSEKGMDASTEYDIQITDASAGGSIKFGYGGPFEKFATNKPLSTGTSSPKILIRPLNFSIYSPLNEPATGASEAEIKMFDSTSGGMNCYGKSDSDGLARCWLPRKYIEGGQEKIKYNITISTTAYNQQINFSDVLVPNEINISSVSSALRYTTFLAGKLIDTDTQYYGYLFYPPGGTQYNFILNETIPSDFTLQNLTIYMANSTGIASCTVPVSGNGFNVSSADCAILSNSLGVSDYLLAVYKVLSPPPSAFFTPTKEYYFDNGSIKATQQTG
jgi:hypothetical protein